MLTPLLFRMEIGGVHVSGWEIHASGHDLFVRTNESKRIRIRGDESEKFVWEIALIARLGISIKRKWRGGECKARGKVFPYVLFAVTDVIG